MHVCVFLVTISSFLCSSIACVSMVFLSFSSWMRFSLAFCSSLHFTATLSSTFWELSINPWPSATTDLTLSSTSCRKSMLERRHSSQGLLKALISIRLTHPCICVSTHDYTIIQLAETHTDFLFVIGQFLKEVFCLGRA